MEKLDAKYGSNTASILEVAEAADEDNNKLESVGKVIFEKWESALLQAAFKYIESLGFNNTPE